MDIGAIFDWDGVIIDSSAAHEVSWNVLAAEEKLPLPEGHFKKGFGRKNQFIIPEILGWSRDPQEIARLGARKEEIYRENLKKTGIEALPGVHDLLEGLRALGVPCVVGSSTPRINIETVMDLAKLRGYFVDVVSAEDVSHGKPHPEVFLKAAGKIARAPGRSVVFEDAFVGLEAARAGGFKCIGVGTTHTVEELRGKCDWAVQRLTEVTAESVIGLVWGNITTQWNLIELRAKVAAKIIECKKFEEALSSFDRRCRIAAYHASEAQTALANKLPPGIPAQFIALIKSFISPNQTLADADIRFAYFCTEANTYAYAQAIHAASDILAKIIFYALELDISEKWKDKYITLASISNSVECPPALKTKIKDLLSVEAYKYLCAFTNTIKHHSLVPTNVPIQWHGESHQWVGVKLNRFDYQDRFYDEKFIREFVSDDFEDLQQGYISIGQQLNEIL